MQVKSNFTPESLELTKGLIRAALDIYKAGNLGPNAALKIVETALESLKEGKS